MEEPHSVLVHPWQLRAVCEAFGIVASDERAAKAICTLQRRMTGLLGRIGHLADWMTNHSDQRHADLSYEITQVQALHDLASEWCAEFPAWFAAVRNISNPAIAAYLQVLLLTGARPGEVLMLRWEDLNTKWRGLTIRDKVEGERVIPLTPYVHHLLAALPRRSEWVFAGAVREPGKAPQPIAKPHHAHAAACKVAGVEGLTFHGLRRSFKSLTEWLEIPAGVVAQIQGHKPSATAEKHYTVRPLDLLRLHHERIEAWILKQAGIVFEAEEAPGALRAVTS